MLKDEGSGLRTIFILLVALCIMVCGLGGSLVTLYAIHTGAVTVTLDAETIEDIVLGAVLITFIVGAFAFLIRGPGR